MDDPPYRAGISANASIYQSADSAVPRSHLPSFHPDIQMSLADVIDGVLSSWMKLLRFCAAVLAIAVATGAGIRLFVWATANLNLEPEEVEFSGSPRVVFKRIVDGKQEVVLVVDPQGWQSSGIDVKAGDDIVIRAGGRINISLSGLLNHVAQRGVIERRILAQLDSGKLELHPSGSRLPERYFTPTDLQELMLVRDWTGPAGYPGADGIVDHRYEARTRNKVLPNAPFGALLGTVHGGTADPVRRDAFSGAFVVGEEHRMVAKKNGTLWFTINDVLDDEDATFPQKFYIDNVGYFLVKITSSDK